MASQSSEFTRKLRGAVRAKIEEYGIEVDDELPDYVMILVGNKKDKARMKSDLKLFLGDNTSDFVEWLFGFFQKVKASGSGTANAGSQPMPKDKSVTIEEAIEEKKKSSNVDKVPAETHSQKKSSSKQHKPRKAELPEAKAPEMRSSKADSKELRSSSKYDRNRKEQRQRPADEASNKRTTIKPILRSVVVQPIHPRIRPRSRSPAPMVICSGLAPNDERNLPAAHPHKVIENEEHPKRRVVATSSGSMLFQRAARALIQTDNEAKTGTGTSHKELDEAKKKKQPENDEMVEALEEKETEKPRAEEDKASMAIINEKKQEQQQQTRMPLAPKMKDRKGPPLVGIGAIFQRAIQQTQNQNEPIKGGGGQQLPMVSERRKRIFDNEQIKESTSKKIRIEFEEIEEQPTEEEENNEEEGSVLVVNMSRPATRSIRKEPRKPPKSGLALLKQHIGVPEELTAGKMEKQTNSLSEVPGTNGKYEKEHGPSSSAQNPNIITTNLNITTAAAPLWNDQFKIDDMSSTDDEAEIDAVLEEQHQLKRMALERESELKGRELPPTSALTRPMHYNEIPTSVQVQPLLSPGEADLLPAIFQPQNLTNLSQKPPLSISTRPFATVAPCSTTTAAPITMFVHQQYQQQNQTFMPQQFVYAPSPAIYMPIPQRPMNRFQTKGSFSKVYSAQVPAMTGKGPLAKAGHDEKLRQLREQHKQMVLKYSKSLEEQRLILAQLKKMSGNPQAEQTVQTLKFRCKKMDAIAKEMKQKLEAMSEEISSLTKQEDSQQIDLASTGSLEVKRFF